MVELGSALSLILVRAIFLFLWCKSMSVFAWAMNVLARVYIRLASNCDAGARE